MTARATELHITYERKTSGSLNNCACKPTDESKRSSALSIDGSSSTRQIMPAAGGPTADEYRGRDIHCWMPPAQIPAGVIHAPGSHLGGLTTNPTSSFAYTVEPLGHVYPAQCPVRVLLSYVSLGPLPWLHPLRPQSPTFVRRLQRDYEEV